MIALAAFDNGVFAKAFVRVGEQIQIVGFFGGVVGVVRFCRAAVNQHRVALHKAARFLVGFCQTRLHQRFHHIQAA